MRYSGEPSSVPGCKLKEPDVKNQHPTNQDSSVNVSGALHGISIWILLFFWCLKVFIFLKMFSDEQTPFLY